MEGKTKFIFLPISLICGGLIALNPSAKAGITTGADIYCVMRDGGNDHEASWEAAYQSIKKQKAGLFKTSPRQAASIIVEEVVSEAEKFEECIKYLGDLYVPKNPPVDDFDPSQDLNQDPEEAIRPNSKGNYEDRYSY